MDFENLLYEKIKEQILSWQNCEDIYGIYFGVSVNLIDGNMPHFMLGYGNGSVKGLLSSKWHLACSSDYECELTADKDLKNEMINYLHGLGIEKIGAPEEQSEAYDGMMMYIGKGPAGMYEVLQAGVTAAERLFDEGVIEEKFGRLVPIIFDDLETTWYCIEATEKANPEGLADEFLKAFSYHRKNSASAINITKVIFYMMSLGRVITFLPVTVTAVLSVLVFGGIVLPLSCTGIAKAIPAALIFLICTAGKIRMLSYYGNSCDSEEKEEVSPFAAFRMAVLSVFDAALASTVMLSVNFMHDKLLAGFLLIGALAYAAIDQLILSGAKKALLNSEKGVEAAKKLDEIRRENAERRMEKSDEEDTDNEKNTKN